MSEVGQKLKSSMRANVFRFAPKSRHRQPGLPCPLSANNGPAALEIPLPFYPRDRTSPTRPAMSVWCQKRKYKSSLEVAPSDWFGCTAAAAGGARSDTVRHWCRDQVT